MKHDASLIIQHKNIILRLSVEFQKELKREAVQIQ